MSRDGWLAVADPARKSRGVFWTILRNDLLSLIVALEKILEEG